MGMLYLARHGQTPPNVDKLLQGAWTDFDLTQEGRRQAALLWKLLRNVHLDAVYHGPRKRHRQTAKRAVTGHPGIVVICREGLNEVDYGASFEGQSYANMPNVIEWLYTHPWPDGETPADMERIAYTEAAFVAGKAKKGDVLVVSSQFRLSTIALALEGRPIRYNPNLNLRNCGAHQYEILESGLAVPRGYNLETLVQ